MFIGHVVWDELLVSQSDHRIHSHGTASGDITGSHSDAEQNEGHGGKCQRRRYKAGSRSTA
jgi:hypothetical protein